MYKCYNTDLSTHFPFLAEHANVLKDFFFFNSSVHKLSFGSFWEKIWLT